MLQNLMFDENCVSFQRNPNPTPFARIVDHVLLLHIGPVCKFVLSNRHISPTAADIDRWVLHLSRSSVKCLKLEIWKGDRYKLTSCFFSCEDLIHLRLQNCILEPPPTFRGFLTLAHLDIENVTLTQHLFEDLIYILLVALCSRNCFWKTDGFKNICINAPNLVVLSIEGEFEEVILQNTLNLASVSMVLRLNVRWVTLIRSSANLLQFLVHLPNIRYLKLDGYSLKYLAVGPSPVKLLQPIPFLNDLSLDLNFNDLEEITVALCLIRSSPTLQRLQIWGNLALLTKVSTWFNCLKISVLDTDAIKPYFRSTGTYHSDDNVVGEADS